jgi:hypothetical protein
MTRFNGAVVDICGALRKNINHGLLIFPRWQYPVF